MSLLDTLKAMRSRPSHKAARFVLRYDPSEGQTVTVGHLEFEAGTWTFRYDEEYKGRSDLRPIEGFDEVDKIYRSSLLFPFFAVRIPDVERADIKLTLERAHVRHPDAIDLLRIFGRRVVSSPAFELLPA